MPATLSPEVLAGPSKRRATTLSAGNMPRMANDDTIPIDANHAAL
jgi:hypothetical protein